MMKKFFLLLVLFVFAFLTSGCITINTDGCCSNKANSCCEKKAVKAEPKESVNPIKVADDWVKKNLW
ncbi:MAG: hypothetical protein WC543_00650 [Candidatus Omnitrophota bacterium]